MTEHAYIRSLHRLLPKEVYAWKIHDTYQGGVADAYYSGERGDLWVEYKFLKLPKKDTTLLPAQFGLSDQQLAWLTDRHYEGRQVRLIVGSENKRSLILSSPEGFVKRVNRVTFLSSAVDNKEVVRHILENTVTEQTINSTTKTAGGRTPFVTTTGALQCGKHPPPKKRRQQRTCDAYLK